MYIAHQGGFCGYYSSHGQGIQSRNWPRYNHSPAVAREQMRRRKGARARWRDGGGGGGGGRESVRKNESVCERPRALT